MSFIIICVLPLDVVITFYNRWDIPTLKSYRQSISYCRCQLEKERISNTTSSSTGPAANISFECEPPTGYSQWVVYPMSSTSFRYVPDDFLLSLWRIVYWTAQLMTWWLLSFPEIDICILHCLGWFFLSCKVTLRLEILLRWVEWKQHSWSKFTYFPIWNLWSISTVMQSTMEST